MIRIISIAILSFLFCNSVLAQDTLFKVNREVVVVKVQQVGPKEIIYKRYSAPEGPIYVIATVDVWKIVYPDGHVDLFNTSSEDAAAAKPITFHPWTVGINAFDLMLGVVTVNGEYKIGKSGLTVKIPFSMGLAALSGKDPREYYYYGTGYNGYYNKDKIFSTGLDLTYSVAPFSKRVSYYFGISWEYGITKYLDNSYQYYPYPYPYPQTPVTKWFTSTGITNGVLFKPSDRMSIGLEFTGGMVVNQSNNDSYNPMARMGINMGWRFGKGKATK